MATSGSDSREQAETTHTLLGLRTLYAHSSPDPLLAIVNATRAPLIASRLAPRLDRPDTGGI